MDSNARPQAHEFPRKLSHPSSKLRSCALGYNTDIREHGGCATGAPLEPRSSLLPAGASTPFAGL